MTTMVSVPRSLVRRGLPRLLLAVGVLGCATAPAPPPAPPAEPAAGPPAASSERLADVETALETERRTTAQQSEQIAELERQLAAERNSRASLEERYATLEHELAGAVEEVLRSTATGRGVHSRAFATSRIAEVRVQLEGLSPAEDPEVAARLEQVGELLTRADRALAEENYGGASYLADRAGEAIRRVRIVAEIRSSSEGEWGEVIPIVPPRRMQAVANANLRAGPAIDEERVAGVQAGAELRALARAGDWLQVETGAGLRAWILGRLAQPL